MEFLDKITRDDVPSLAITVRLVIPRYNVIITVKLEVERRSVPDTIEIQWRNICDH